MDELDDSCRRALQYPLNLIEQDTYVHHLRPYFTRLNERENSLFHKDVKPALDFWDYEIGTGRFELRTARDVNETRQFLHAVAGKPRYDPRCRFLFVYGRHSRDALRSTREMLMLAFSHHQVMPTFLDFLFPFGKQQYPQDFHFSGFRQENRLSIIDRGLQIPELSRSGQELQLCYSLKSVEPSKWDKDWPWSVRQCAVYHSFDVQTGKTSWIVIKGDGQMKKRLIKVSEQSRYLNLLKSGIGRAFVAALESHLFFCDWAGENWRWYLNALEEALQTVTRHTSAVVVDTSSPAVENGQPRFVRPQRNLTGMETLPEIPTSVAHQMAARKDADSRNRPLPPQEFFDEPKQPPELPPAPEARMRSDSPDEFSFRDLQRLQYIEEKANEVLLVLETNTNVLGDLRKHYEIGIELSDMPKEIRVDCNQDVARFVKRVLNVENDLKMQQSRAKTLLTLLSNRKSVLYGILEYRNMEASRLLTKKAQLSADNMESMTSEMSEIARKTKQETVLMRIITLITLFFLPGTFISTLMSTDIVSWEDPNDAKERVFQSGALLLFSAITVPLMVLTFLASYCIYRCVRRSDAKSREGQLPV